MSKKENPLHIPKVGEYAKYIDRDGNERETVNKICECKILHYMGQDTTIKPHAGLFWYEGLGQGAYFITDTLCVDCNRRQARLIKKQYGVTAKFCELDCFEYYTPIYVGD